MEKWIISIEKAVKAELEKTTTNDASHDFGHLYRVTRLARRFAREEQADELIVFAAGMLHDIVTLPKNSPERHLSSLLASKRAEEILNQLQFPQTLISQVCHAIHAHSFSAKVETRTIEAKCVQDADRMEALGAFGLMRVFYCSGKFNSQVINQTDPWGNNRNLDDTKFALDHFPLKLLTLQETIKTKAGKEMAICLTNFLKEYRDGVISDHLEGTHTSSRFKIANIYHNAGKNGLALFHPCDPFSKNGRHHNTREYALDSILQDQDPYIKNFLEQLKYELNGYQK